MPVEDHAVWDHAFPVRYLLGRQDAELAFESWGRCADVEGLFVDPVPPPREVLTLRGCSLPESRRDAPARPDQAARFVGDLEIGLRDDRRPQFRWTLVDAVVIAQWAHADDPALFDVVIGAGVVEYDEVWTGAGPGTVPEVPLFEIWEESGGGGVLFGKCGGVDGLFAPRKAPADRPLQLIGCEPGEPLLAVLRDPRAWQKEWGLLAALDRTGRRMGYQEVRLEISDVRPSVLGGPLVDITLADGGDEDRPSLAARRIWETWYRGLPATPGQWAPLDTRGRAEWLRLVRPRRADGPDRTGGTHHLEGRFVTDRPGLYCALGEALVGPGCWIGRGYDDFKDCLSGGWGVVGPFTLVWHDAAVARLALNSTGHSAGRSTYFEDVVRLLERHGVTVVLQ